MIEVAQGEKRKLLCLKRTEVTLLLRALVRSRPAGPRLWRVLPRILTSWVDYSSVFVKSNYVILQGLFVSSEIYYLQVDRCLFLFTICISECSRFYASHFVFA
jgi:hypothetical protein